MKTRTLNCLLCGISFTTTSPVKKFCSLAHGKKYHRPVGPQGPLCLCGCGGQTSSKQCQVIKGHRKLMNRGLDAMAKSIRTTDGCLEFQGGKNADGYGILRGKDTDLTHRAVWIHFNGPIPPGMEICHHCDNPPCVEIDHLFLGTHEDNMKDCGRKGRAGGWAKRPPRGELQANSELREEQVTEIRRRYAGFSTPRGTKYGILTVLANEYGISKENVRQITLGNTWGHVA